MSRHLICNRFIQIVSEILPKIASILIHSALIAHLKTAVVAHLMDTPTKSLRQMPAVDLLLPNEKIAHGSYDRARPPPPLSIHRCSRYGHTIFASSGFNLAVKELLAIQPSVGYLHSLAK